jgi:hypothetical protein
VIALNPQEVKYGTPIRNRIFCKWSEEDTAWQGEYARDMSATVIYKCRIGRLIRCCQKNDCRFGSFYILFDKGVKKIARYQQYLALKTP